MDMYCNGMDQYNDIVNMMKIIILVVLVGLSSS